MRSANRVQQFSSQIGRNHVSAFRLLRVWIVLLVTGVVVSSVPAATFVVTTADDSGDGSLRGAINQANASAGLDTVSFNIPGIGPHTIPIQYALPGVTDTILIDGVFLAVSK